MIKNIKKIWHQKPLLSLIVLGLFFRLISVIFSKGWGMIDDQFLVIEPAQKLLALGENIWSAQGKSNIPNWLSYFYLGIHFLFFKFCEIIGIKDPQIKMYFVRFIHAIYSLSIIYLGYKITEKISEKILAKKVGLLLAILWLFPILSVRNLVEYVCIPPILMAVWVIIKEENKNKWQPPALSGLFAGLSMGIRFQTMFFVAGLGLYFLLNKRWRNFIIFSSFFVISFFITQITDLLVCGVPFVKFYEYIKYNLENSTTYFSRSWYMYFGTIVGLLLPPISMFFIIGFWKMRKKYLVIFLPTFIFFVMHSIFPNKQERFILPIIPFLIILGTVGWFKFIEKSKFWQKKINFHRNLWRFFWIINTILLIVITPTYTKKTRVTSMYWLYKQADFKNFIIENSYANDVHIPAQFYLNNYQKYFYITKKDSIKKVRQSVKDLKGKIILPNYIIFFENTDLNKRVNKFEKEYGAKLCFKKLLEPSFIDWLLYTINPNNENYIARIYKIEYL